MPHTTTLLRTLACTCVGAFVGFLLSDTHPHALMSPEIEMLVGGVSGLIVGAVSSKRLSARAARDASARDEDEP